MQSTPQFLRIIRIVGEYAKRRRRLPVRAGGRRGSQQGCPPGVLSTASRLAPIIQRLREGALRPSPVIMMGAGLLLLSMLIGYTSRDLRNL